MSNFELYIESGRERLRQLEDFMEVAKRVKGIAEGFWRGAKVYVFGSVVEGRLTAMSDIDMLIVADSITREDAYRVKALIYSAIDAPIELHVASSEEFERWYRRFINKLQEVP